MTAAAETSGGALRRALGNLSLKGLSLALERLCRLVVVIASARVLGEAAFGRFVYASTVTTLLALGTDLGLGVWTTRALARDRSDVARVVRVGLGLRSAAALPYGLAITAVATLAVRGEARAAIALLGIAALAGAFVDHFGAILRGYERFADEARLNTSRALLTAVAGLMALTLSHSLAGVCAGLAAANMGSGIYGWIAIGPLRSARADSTNAKIDWTLSRRALRESLPLWLAGLLSVLYFKVDTLFLRAMTSDGELGAYGAAYKFFEGAMMVPAVLLAVAFPQLARAHGDRVTQRRLERQVSGILLALGVFAGAVCLLGGATLVRVVFGAEFGRAVASLRVLSLGLPLVFVNYGLTHFLVARDMGRLTMWFALMMLALTVGLDVALIPRLAGPGAAWATVLAEIALTATCAIALKPSAPAADASQPLVSASAAPSVAPSGPPPVVSPLQATSTPIARVAKRSQNR